MLWAALAYATGIATGFYLWRPPQWWLVAAIAFSVAGAYFLRRRPKLAFALALSALSVTGALMMQVRAPENQESTGALAFADGRDVVVTAHITREGNLQGKDVGGEQQRVDLETEQIGTGDESFGVRSGLRVSIYGHDETKESQAVATPMRPFRYGERLRFPVKLYPPRNFRNPGAFDYTGYLAENGIVALGSTKAESVEVLRGFAGNRAELWRTRLRRSLIEKIHQLWKPDEAPLLDAMLIGENSFLGRETLTDFQRTGTYHVLVISGLKVAVLALVMFWLLRRMRVSDLVASTATILLMVAYALLTDVGAPVWRATLMLALYLGARLLYRRKSILNTIGGAALALLVVDPAALLGASFQLSFLCVLVIAGIATPFLERTTKPLSRALKSLDATGYDAALSPPLAQLRLDIRMVASRLQRFLGKRFPMILLPWVVRALLVGCEFFCGFRRASGRIRASYGLLLSSRDTGLTTSERPSRTSHRNHYDYGDFSRDDKLHLAHAGEVSCIYCGSGAPSNEWVGAMVGCFADR
jgi:competence protein ComEC